MEIVHNKERRHYVLLVDGHVARVDYVLKNDLMYLTHSEVPVSLRGQGIGKKLVLLTFEKLTEEGYKAIAVCSYIKLIAQRSDVWRNIIS